MKTTNYSELRNNMKDYFDAVISDCEPLVVHRSGKESVVVISLKDYNSIIETEYLLSNPANVEHLREGIAQANNGETVKVDIKDLWK